MTKKPPKSKSTKEISENLAKDVLPGVKKVFDREEPGAYAHCAAQNCGGNYNCGGPGSHSCTTKFDCSGQKYSGSSGESCPREFNCHHEYTT